MVHNHGMQRSNRHAVPRDIVVEVGPLRNYFTGLGQFCWHLSRHLRVASQISFYVPAAALSRVDLSPEQVIVERWWHPWLLPRCRVWHSTQQYAEIFPTWRLCRRILTIHDLIPLDEPGADSRSIRRFRRNLAAKIARSAALTYPSEFVQRHVRSEFVIPAGTIERVIYNAPALLDVPPERPLLPDGFPELFLLTVSTVLPRKNVHVLLPMLERLPDRIGLVVAGTHTSDYAVRVREQATGRGLERRVVFLGEVTEAQKLWLYDHAALLVFPSLQEGFGLPVVEAMQRGLPAVIARRTSLPEIGGDVAFYFDTDDPADMAATVQTHLASRTTRPDLVDRLRAHASRFTWEVAAREYQALYRELLDS